MTAHDQNDATTKISITTLTTASDCRNNATIERSCGTELTSGRASTGVGGITWRPFYGVFWTIYGITGPVRPQVPNAAARANRAEPVDRPAAAGRDGGRRRGSALGHAT